MTTSEARHAWLEKARTYCVGLLAEVDCKVPDNVRVTIGFPCTGGRGKTIGQCMYDIGVSDQHHEIFISPVLADGARILDVLLHELIHASLPVGSKHGPAFKAAATKAGLTGKMTATVASEELAATFAAWVEANGPYPAGSINLEARKKQKTKLLKAECEGCGYLCRVTEKWVVEVGPPHCPDHGAMAVEGLSERDPTPVTLKELLASLPEEEIEEEPEVETEEEEPEAPLEMVEITKEEATELFGEPEETDEDFILTGYRVRQSDPEHTRFAIFADDERAAAEAKARQWSKTGRDKHAVCQAHRDGEEVGSKDFFAGLSSGSANGEYPLV